MIKYLLILLFSGISLLGKGQDIGRSPSNVTSDRMEYFKTVKLAGDSAVMQKDYQKLAGIGALLLKDFGTLSSTEHKALRSAAMYLGNRINRYTPDYNAALQLYLTAHAHVDDKQYLDSLAWYIENEISTIYIIKNDFEKAAYFGTLLENSLKHFGMTEYLTRYYTNLGTNLLAQKKETEAIATFRLGYHIADSIHYNNGIFANAINLAEIYTEKHQLDSSGNYLILSKEVLPFLIADRRYLDKLADYEFENAKYKVQRGELVASIPWFHQSIKTLESYTGSRTRRAFAQNYVALVRVYLQLDSTTKAEHVLDTAFMCLVPEFQTQEEYPAVSQLYAESAFVTLFDLKKEILLNKYAVTSNPNYLIQALECIERALLVRDLMRNQVVADESKLISIRMARRFIQDGIRISHQLYATNPQLYFDTARMFFNRSKAVLLEEKLRNHELITQWPESEKQILDSLQRQLALYFSQKYDQGSDLNAINGRIIATQEEINTIFSGHHGASLAFDKPKDYIEYAMEGNDIFVLAELGSKKLFLQLDTLHEFQAALISLEEFITLKGLSDDDMVLKKLYRLLIEPLHQHLPDHLVIIPDNALCFVPFEILKNDNDQYLIEQTCIAYGYQYLTPKVLEKEKQHDPLVFCLQPEYNLKATTATAQGRGSLYDLPYAKMEVDSIKAIYSQAVSSSHMLKADEWQSTLAASTIFHYAGHAMVATDAAYLALSSSDTEEGKLTDEEIAMMPQSLDLVVLSACETGLGKVEQGEGIRSLGRSFVEAGADATVISLWNVNDQSTASIMTHFYRNLKAGLPKDDALRKAKMDYLQSATEARNHPYYWAAFIPAGNMLPLKVL